jgi:transposase
MNEALQTDDIEALRRLAASAWRRAEDLAKEKAVAVQEKAVAEAKLSTLESENAVLLRQIADLTIKLANASHRDTQLALELQLRSLRQALSANAETMYGDKSERRGHHDAESEPKKKSKKPGHGPTPQPDLPVEPQVHALHGDDCSCSSCGSDLRVLGECHEESELIASVRRTFVLKQVQRTKYACTRCGDIRTAPGPLKLIPGGRYDLSFTVQVALDKYLDALPLERQVGRMRRVGLKVTSQTLWDQVFAMYVVLLPSLLALHDAVLAEPLVHADESPWRMMGKGRSKKWWLWTLVSAKGSYFDIQPSRGSAAARAVFKGYAGTVMADGYVVYASLEGALDKHGAPLDLGDKTLLLPNFVLAGCWMHARRPLFKAEKNGPEATTALDLIGELYAVEAEAKELAGDDLDALLHHRQRLRQERSRGIIDQLGAWRDAQRPLPKTQYAKGVDFLKSYWTVLTRFLDDPRIPLDNGEAERRIRGPVIGRKNYYGVRSERGARVASLFFSLIATCKQHDVDPFAYLMEATRRGLRSPGTVYLPWDHPTQSSQVAGGAA